MELLSAKEAAAVLGIHPTGLKGLVDSEKLRPAAERPNPSGRGFVRDYARTDLDAYNAANGGPKTQTASARPAARKAAAASTAYSPIVTVKELANYYKVTTRTIQKAIQASGIKPAGRQPGRGNKPYYATESLTGIVFSRRVKDVHSAFAEAAFAAKKKTPKTLVHPSKGADKVKAIIAKKAEKVTDELDAAAVLVFEAMEKLNLASFSLVRDGANGPLDYEVE